MLWWWLGAAVAGVPTQTPSQTSQAPVCDQAEQPPQPESAPTDATEVARATACLEHAEHELVRGRAERAWSSAQAARVDALNDHALSTVHAVLRLRWCTTESCYQAVTDAWRKSGSTQDRWDWDDYLTRVSAAAHGEAHAGVVRAVSEPRASRRNVRRAVAELRRARSHLQDVWVDNLDVRTAPRIRWPRQAASGTGDVTCIARLTINRDGTPWVIDATRCPAPFDDAAFRDLATGRFEPASTDDGPQPTASWIVLNYVDPQPRE